MITHLFDILGRKKKYDIENFSIDRVLNKEHFMDALFGKCAPKARPRLLFNFGK